MPGQETTQETKTYRLMVYCRRNDVSRDAGEHARGDYENDAAAVRALRPKVQGLFRYYDQVSYSIWEGEREVTAR